MNAILLRKPIAACLAVGLLISSASAQEAKVTSVRRIGNDVELKFTGTAGVLYTVQQSGTLDVGSWLPAGTAATGTGAEQTLLVAGAGVTGKNFLRLSYAAPSAPPGYVRIPGGTFTMGDQSSPYEGHLRERPPISVTLGEFFIKATEVTKTEWDATAPWALANGYTFGSQAGTAKGPDYPVTFVNWYDAVKWCNAKSEQEGLVPCYVIPGPSPGVNLVYRTGSPSRIGWLFGSNGYRLPCEAEWEKAARGGVPGRRFPSGTFMNHSVANYHASTGSYAYDNSGVNISHPAYNTGAVLPYTAPVGSFPANPYGLHDLEGNVREYCWDRSTSDYSEGYQVQFESASSLFPRITRGGDWSSDAYTARCSYRASQFPDTGRNNYTGFRPAKGPLQ